jgi:hypothetical protein
MLVKPKNGKRGEHSGKRIAEAGKKNYKREREMYSTFRGRVLANL